MKGAILVVEDEQAIADLVRAYLKRDGFGVVWASSGEQAMEELSRHAVRLVVLAVWLVVACRYAVARRAASDLLRADQSPAVEPLGQHGRRLVVQQS